MADTKKLGEVEYLAIELATAKRRAKEPEVIPPQVDAEIRRLLRETSLSYEEIARLVSTDDMHIHPGSVSSRSGTMFGGETRPQNTGLSADAAAEAALRYLIDKGHLKEALAKLLEKGGFLMNNPSIAIEQHAKRRGPQPGTGGRPPKAGTRRVTRGVNMTPETWTLVEQARLPGESLGDVVERLLRRPN